MGHEVRVSKVGRFLFLFFFLPKDCEGGGKGERGGGDLFVFCSFGGRESRPLFPD